MVVVAVLKPVFTPPVAVTVINVVGVVEGAVTVTTDVGTVFTPPVAVTVITAVGVVEGGLTVITAVAVEGGVTMTTDVGTFIKASVATGILKILASRFLSEYSKTPFC